MASATRKAAFSRGEVIAEGVVCEHTEAGVLIGREAQEGEVCPPRHKEYTFGAKRAFLSLDQAPIPPAGLHKRKAR